MTAPGSVSWLGYGWETSYAAVSTSMNKAFGHGVRVTALNRKNNIEDVYSTGSKVAQKLIPKKYEGSMSVEFILANPWIFQAILGTPSTSGTGPYVHTFAEADTVSSFTVENNYQLAAVRRAQLLGCTVNQATLSSAVGELVRMRADIPFANEAFSTTTTSKVTDSFDLFTFAQATLEAPDGSTLAMVQNVDLNIVVNPELVYGQGSRFAQSNPIKNRVYTGSVTMALQASVDLLEKFYGSATGPIEAGPTEVATLVMNFTNGLTGTNSRSIIATYTGVQIDEDSLPQDPTQILMEDVNLKMRTLTVVATNNTSASP